MVSTEQEDTNRQRRGDSKLRLSTSRHLLCIVHYRASCDVTREFLITAYFLLGNQCPKCNTCNMSSHTFTLVRHCMLMARAHLWAPRSVRCVCHAALEADRSIDLVAVCTACVICHMSTVKIHNVTQDPQ